MKELKLESSQSNLSSQSVFPEEKPQILFNIQTEQKPIIK